MRMLALLLANAHTLVFVLGFVLLYVGLAGWSVPAARVVAGLVLMLVALAPYIRLFYRAGIQRGDS